MTRQPRRDLRVRVAVDPGKVWEGISRAKRTAAAAAAEGQRSSGHCRKSERAGEARSQRLLWVERG